MQIIATLARRILIVLALVIVFPISLALSTGGGSRRANNTASLVDTLLSLW